MLQIVVFENCVDYQKVAKIAHRFGFKDETLDRRQAEKLIERVPYDILYQEKSSSCVYFGTYYIARKHTDDSHWYVKRNNTTLTAQTAPLLFLKFIQMIEKEQSHTVKRKYGKPLGEYPYLRILLPQERMSCVLEFDERDLAERLIFRGRGSYLPSEVFYFSRKHNRI